MCSLAFTNSEDVERGRAVDDALGRDLPEGVGDDGQVALQVGRELGGEVVEGLLGRGRGVLALHGRASRADRRP